MIAIPGALFKTVKCDDAGSGLLTVCRPVFGGRTGAKAEVLRVLFYHLLAAKMRSEGENIEYTGKKGKKSLGYRYIYIG